MICNNVLYDYGNGKYELNVSTYYYNLKITRTNDNEKFFQTDEKLKEKLDEMNEYNKLVNAMMEVVKEKDCELIDKTTKLNAMIKTEDTIRNEKIELNTLIDYNLEQLHFFELEKLKKKWVNLWQYLNEIENEYIENDE